MGIVLAALSLVVMPMLTYAKLHTGRDMGSRALVADFQRPGFAHTCRWRYLSGSAGSRYSAGGGPTRLVRSPNSMWYGPTAVPSRS